MSRAQEIGVGCLLIGALGAFAALAMAIGGGLRGCTDSVDVTAVAVDAAGLKQRSAVHVAGVKVGQVSELLLQDGAAVAHLALEPGANLRRGTTARIRPSSLLGEKYVELTPGPSDGPLLADGDALAPIPPQVEIDELVDAIGPLVGALDPEVVRKVAEALADALRDDPERLARMLADAETVLANGAEASAELPELVSDARSALAQTRATLSTVDARAREAQATIARADRVLADLESAAEPLPAVVADARAAVADARAAMAKVDAAAVDLDTALQNLAAFDREEIVRLLRDEGVRVRLAGRKEKR